MNTDNQNPGRQPAEVLIRAYLCLSVVVIDFDFLAALIGVYLRLNSVLEL
jgi:hypothetical protein